MKTVVVVGDNAIPVTLFKEEFAGLEQKNVALRWVQWQAPSAAEFSRWTRSLEQRGPESMEAPAELVDAVADCDVLVVHWCPVQSDLVRAAANLKLVATARAGLENLALESLRERRIPIMHALGRNADTVADYTVGLLLAESRNIARGHELLRKGEWRRAYPNAEFITDLSDSVVGIVGFGHIGRQVARRLAAFGAKLIGYDPYVADEAFTSCGVTRVALDDLVARADYVTIHVRLTESTRDLIGRRQLRMMKPTAYLINTARAAVVNQEALAEALQSGHLAGAALDVFEEEPLPPSSPFMGLGNVTITPHLAGRTVSGYRKGPRMVCNALCAMASGQRVDESLLVNADAVTDELMRKLRVW